jgi:tetratricopeptide (TPR) repeat protein
VTDTLSLHDALPILGLIALEQKKPDDCLTQLKEASQQDPYVIFFSAKAYNLKGDKQKAKELCEKAMNFNLLPNLNTTYARLYAKNMLKGI